jgi:hypothetical protein
MTIEPFKVLCINDKNIPKEIPEYLRVVDGEVYTAEGLVHLLSSAIIGIIISEKPLGEECFPYHYWGAHRFIPYEQDMIELEREIEMLIESPIKIN